MERLNTWVESGYITEGERNFIENVEVMSKGATETVVKVSDSLE
jgi:hypothetical protein